MLEQANCLDLNEPANHVAEDGANSVKTFVRGANIAEAGIVEEDLLHDENCNCL